MRGLVALLVRWVVLCGFICDSESTVVGGGAGNYIDIGGGVRRPRPYRAPPSSRHRGIARSFLLCSHLAQSRLMLFRHRHVVVVSLCVRDGCAGVVGVVCRCRCWSCGGQQLQALAWQAGTGTGAWQRQSAKVSVSRTRRGQGGVAGRRVCTCTCSMYIYGVCGMYGA
jgi:hypothetical protein